MLGAIHATSIKRCCLVDSTQTNLLPSFSPSQNLMASSSSSPKKVKLKSSDGFTFVVDEEVAMVSGTIKRYMDDDSTGEEIPLPNVTSDILRKVIMYLMRHVKANKELGSSSPATCDILYDEFKRWDKRFLAVDQDTLFALVNAANYLNIKSLLDLTCETVAKKISGMSTDEVRDYFKIENDITPEDEKEIREEEERIEKMWFEANTIPPP